MENQAAISRLANARGNSLALNAFLIACGVLLLSLLAQVTIPLPFTPVPLTGQTFGVALIALLFGRNRGLAVLTGYLGIGALGAPVFSAGGSGLTVGPTLGYLVGMLFASIFVGWLSDRGWCRSILSAYLAASLGSILVFCCGLISLSFFVSTSQLLQSGLFPFLPGDILKNLTAAAITVKISKGLK